jgi:surface carbohydrate biosynthesis protein
MKVTADKVPLLITVGWQVREYDARLLLACIAARRGFLSVIGPRREIEFRLPSFPRSIYISNNLMAGTGTLFRILSRLGHERVAWDEEGFIHQLPEVYYSARISPQAVKYVSHLLAWGRNNAELWRQYPQLNTGTPIHITGNPRGDMLRPEIRPFFNNEVEELRKAYGDFILINTNFTAVNAFVPGQNLFFPSDNSEEEPRFARAARGMTREYAEGLRDHTTAIFDDFKRLIPALERHFPNYTLVVRPHPSENQGIYHDIAAKCERVQVINRGNVVPWLMAAKALVHHGCTTGIEAYALRVPAVAYRATVNEYYDKELFRLPNVLSYQCFDFEELLVTLGRILSGELGAADGDERETLIDRYLAAREGPLACERIVDVFEEALEGRDQLPKPPLASRLEGLYRATTRRFKKRYKSRLPGSIGAAEVQRHRYPGISLEEVRARISRFQQLLGESRELKVEQISGNIFGIRR